MRLVFCSLDDVEETSPPLPARARSLTPLENDDVNIHVHKEGGTGGGICAKLVFFVLLSALAVLVGLIYTEHRGLTDRRSLVFLIKLEILIFLICS